MRSRKSLPKLTAPQILAWAEAHHRRTGRWPSQHTGPIPEVPGETWGAVNEALREGRRGLRGRSSLARLWARYGKKRNHLGLPPLSQNKILAWADEHHRRTGRWPTTGSGPVRGSPGERWGQIDNALRRGLRGLPGGCSLPQLLVTFRQARHRLHPPPLTVAQILEWAESHYLHSGRWPWYKSGSVADAPGETWAAVNQTLTRGTRGLPGGSSLAALLSQQPEPILLGLFR